MYYGTNGLGWSWSFSTEGKAGSSGSGDTTQPTSSETEYTYVAQPTPTLDISRLQPATPMTVDPDVPTSAPVDTSASAAAAAAAARGMQESYGEYMRRLAEKRDQLIACGVPADQAADLLSDGEDALDEAITLYCGDGNTMLWVGGIIAVVLVGGVALYMLSR